MTDALPKTIMLVDDDDVFRQRLVRAFERRGYRTHGADGPAAALALAQQHHPGQAVVDLRMPGGSGLELVKALKAMHPAMRIVVLTGYGSIATAIEAIRLGATYYLPKPASAEDIIAAFLREQLPPLEAVPGNEPAPSLARAEWEHINRVLTDCGGNISEAARRLGIHRRSLQRKLQKYPPKH